MYFIIRKIGVSEHPVVIVFYLMGISSVLAGIFSLITWIPPKQTDWFLLLGVGALGYLAQLFMTKALQMEKANRIVPLQISGGYIHSLGRVGIFCGVIKYDRSIGNQHHPPGFVGKYNR